ncbi:hypothetical protein PYW07_009724 [Mythimna separata]|uniref:Myrosinase 1-like n=1 Tax=Mythimna separata TaxID=271217 RepID=A0AAD8DMI5_MYTSE|nr:hypothetical protein PYW07_009724 [Mythimna separata]
MSYLDVIVFCILISAKCCSQDVVFPSWFKFGAASAAYQIEGGWNASDKGESMWDKLLHTQPRVAADGANGDVACDSYHLWRRDIEMCVELGLELYRFSISWPRLLPSGFPNHISEDGKNYYNNLINGLLEKGIEPVVTLYHFDLPQSLQDLGGWANPLIADWFADYARVVFTLYGDRVKTWLTLNEPFGICDVGYNLQQAPYLNDTEVGRYLCNKNTMLAHAKAWRLYQEEFKPRYHGKVSLSTLFIWYEPLTPDDKEVTELTIEHWEGRYAHPIFSKEGGWPPRIQQFLDNAAKKEGYHRPRLPTFTAEEIELVRGTYDFYGLNHYTTRKVRKAKFGEEIESWPFYGSKELGIVLENDRSWPLGSVDWFAMYPEGLWKQLHWLKDTYGVQEILITENGYVNVDDDLNDWKRMKYIRDNLEQIQYAIEDGINVTGYIHWTLMDNFEWLAGYKVNFGLYAVNFTDPERKRTPRESARYYSKVTRGRSYDYLHVGLYE